ncbi:hypothetical protein C1J00_40060 [Streptomyces cahuitamycinicus]|uniref:Uncharacterized protein n=1 Tax=Streptomyces cahuitamycinicus TaxID=2070367 RepID=A0A2N8TCL8_9ACTN|nr:hypothetical protein C1J00_40060 [Streptomyces cahuitamycinicus]
MPPALTAVCACGRGAEVRHRCPRTGPSGLGARGARRGASGFTCPLARSSGRAPGLPSRPPGPGATGARMPARAEGPGARSAAPGNTRATTGGSGVTGPGARVRGLGTGVADRGRAGVGGARAAGIPVASTPSSALRVHVPAPAPLIRPVSRRPLTVVATASCAVGS